MSVKRFTPAIETNHKSGIESPVMVENKTGSYYRIDDYQKLESQLAAIKEENERLKVRVAELEKESISRSIIISRLQKLPDDHRMNLHDAEIIWGIIESINNGDFDSKELNNEG